MTTINFRSKFIGRGEQGSSRVGCWLLPKRPLKVIVKDGWITLEGTAEWQYQKTSAETAVRKVKGVKGVTNVITVKPKVQPTELKRKIQEAFKRNAEVDADRITVEANGSEVVLKGTVRSWIEREEAERVAWSAPGITHVEDRIVVSP